ncbi:AAA family ATPase [Gluconacetobacter diazotrophicus]|uniref:AAA family ATPase n=1 Tax=Gluconacetobacter diazotrophicus TaxID=33996 RepID=UPI00119C8027|nr:AAA family ATPase [Gluconacetobacter diazotrophicus]TWA98288.1 putative AbiEii toxin of type IV toxin-antitoxin system [Gluconacetobacter diazotrophicus]
MTAESIDNDFNYHILVSRERKKEVNRRIIYIQPRDSDWNDYGFKTRVTFRIVGPEENQDFYVSGYIGFLPRNPMGIRERDDIFSQSSKSIMQPFTWENFHFFSMLENMEMYRKVVSILGPNEAKRVLLSLKDLVALQEFDPKTNWLDLAINSEEFSISFMRNSDTAFAYYNAYSVLKGIDNEKTSFINKDISVSFKLNTREYHYNFKFSHISEMLPKNLAVIIGKNGVGKSQTLNVIAKSLMKKKRMVYETETRNLPIFNRILAFAPTNEAESVFPSIRSQSYIPYFLFSLNRSRRSSRKNSVINLIKALATINNPIFGMSRWSYFIKAINIIDRDNSICLQKSDSASGYISIYDIVDDNEYNLLKNLSNLNWRSDPKRLIKGNLFSLSSGEISFLRFAAQLSLHIENGSLILLDEPETHLHPNLISHFTLVLYDFLEKTGSIAIAATHSAYFVRNVFRDQVHVLDVRDNIPIVTIPRLRTFGGDVGAISNYVFGEDEQTEFVENIKHRIMKSYNNWKEISDNFEDELSSEFLMEIMKDMEE